MILMNKLIFFPSNCSMHIVAADPIAQDTDIDQKIVEKERSIYIEQLKSSGKPKDILDKIVEGKIKKFCSDVCLLEQTFLLLIIKHLLKNVLILLTRKIRAILRFINI